MLRYAVVLVLAVVVAIMTGWCAGALYYSQRGGSATGAVLAIAFVLATALAFLVLPQRGRTLTGFVIVFLLVVVWWLFVPASSDRDWLPDVFVAPWGSHVGDRVTIHGVLTRRRRQARRCRLPRLSRDRNLPDSA